MNPKGPYLSLEEEKDNFCVVFTYSIKWACEIRKFHVAGVQRRQRNVQNSVMHVQSCCFVNKNLFFAVLLPSPLSLVLLSSRISATVVTWHHTSLYNFAILVRQCFAGFYFRDFNRQIWKKGIKFRKDLSTIKVN